MKILRFSSLFYDKKYCFFLGGIVQSKSNISIIQDENSLKNDVIAENKVKGYTVNLSLDSMKTDKSNQLLITSIDNWTEFDY